MCVVVGIETRKRTMMKRKSSNWRWDTERIIECTWCESRLSVSGGREGPAGRHVGQE